MSNYKKNHRTDPPRWLDKLVQKICAPHRAEEVMGDLHERYLLRVQKFGEKKARRNYLWEVISFLRPYIFKRKTNQFQHTMFIRRFIHNLHFTARSLSRNKILSSLNILGLALGLASAMMIYLWTQDELQKDNFHAKGDQLYRVYSRIYSGDNMETLERTSALLPAELVNTIPEIELASGFAKELRLSKPGEVEETFQVGDKIYKLRGTRAGEDFFKMFSYPLLYGNKETALSDLKGVAISRKMANLFFDGPQEAIDQTIQFNNEGGNHELKVTAVFEDIPVTSTDQFDYITNWEEWVQNDEFKKYWGHLGTYTYVQLRKEASPVVVETRLKRFLDKYMGVTEDSDFHIELGLQPFGEKYLYGNFENGIPAAGRILYVRLFSIVGLFIILIACINFMNLATARATKRAKDVGIRKIMGAHKWHLVSLFLSEAFLITLIAVLIALSLVFFTLPWFNGITAKQMTVDLTSPLFLTTVVGLILSVTLMAGAYPAFLLSSFKPARSLKGNLMPGFKATIFRKGLVIFQFMLSIMLIIATIVVTRQTAYLQNKDLGYNRENVIYIPMEGKLLENYLTFKKEAIRMPGIKLVDRSSQTPHFMGFSGPFVSWEGMDENNQVVFTPNSVGFDYAKLMELEILEGRDFSLDFPADTTSFIVSDFAVKRMGLETPIGSRINIFGKTGPIVGVFKDVHTQSLHQHIRPLVLDVKEHLNFGTILVRTEAGKTREALANLEKLCKEFNPGYAFTYSFLDDAYTGLYKSENIISKLSNISGGLAIFIACLGLLGLAMFTAEMKVKEMGIRKVLGASFKNILLLFSKDFLWLVTIAFLIAAPLGWFVMGVWLQNFAYNIDLSWWIFAVAGALSIFISLLTISVQGIKTALTNPVNTLRSE